MVNSSRKDPSDWYMNHYEQVTTGDAIVPWGDVMTTSVPVHTLDFADEDVVVIDKDFHLTGKEFKSCLKVLMKIVESDYPEELL